MACNSIEKLKKMEKEQDVRKDTIGGQYKPLNSQDIETIHQASLEILVRTGVQVDDPNAKLTFVQGGAKAENNRVRIPPDMVEDAINSAPSRILLAGRNPENDLILAGKQVHLGTGGSALQVLDIDTAKIRPAILQDIGEIARLVDFLENVNFYLLPVYPTDIPDGQVEINRFYAALANTTKHVMGGAFSLAGFRDVIAIAEKIAGGRHELRERPIVSFITSWMVSPLKFASDVTKILAEVCRQHMPVVLSAAPMAGSTAPVTLAGLLAQLNAEQLAGLTFTQLIQPGCPVIIGPIPATANMRSGSYLGGSVELGLCNAAITQMAHFYQVPIYNSAGMTEAKIPDIQAGIEKTQSIIQVALAGGNFIHHAAGMLEDMSTVAYEQYVIDNEILGMAMRAVRGIEINSETLAIEVIDRVGPGGHFLLDPHTTQFMRQEHHYPSKVFDRQRRDRWNQAGAKTAWERAKDAARNILAEHIPDPINPEIDAWIRDRFEVL
jgi:trimethylamine--corrinoid protein Co-methyltransferase